MGRKIPGRKHRGIRDPEKQRLERFNSIKHKINTPPSNPDDQQIPKSLQRLAELRDKVRNGDFKRKKTKKPRPEQFEQRPHETDRAFLLRVNRACAVAKHEAAFEEKYGVEVKRNEQGEVEEVKKRPKDIVQVMMKEERMKKKKKKSKQVEDSKLSKGQKRRIKLAEKKKKKLDKNVDEWSKFKDKVEFGEQAHAPPSLTLPTKNKIVNGAPRPGTKNLLLKTMLKTNSQKVDMTAKRKDLPNALRRQLDKERDDVIKAYRLQKKKSLFS